MSKQAFSKDWIIIHCMDFLNNSIYSPTCAGNHIKNRFDVLWNYYVIINVDWIFAQGETPQDIIAIICYRYVSFRYRTICEWLLNWCPPESIKCCVCSSVREFHLSCAYICLCNVCIFRIIIHHICHNDTAVC